MWYKVHFIQSHPVLLALPDGEKKSELKFHTSAFRFHVISLCLLSVTQTGSEVNFLIITNYI